MNSTTLKLKIKLQPEVKNRLLLVAKQHNNVVRFCFNRYKDNPNASDTEINKIAKSTLKNIPDIDMAWIENCRKQAKAIWKSSKKNRVKISFWRFRKFGKTKIRDC